MTLQPTSAVTLNYILTSLALAIQIANAIYGVKHAMRKRTSFNAVLAGCMIVYAASFIPLLFTARLAVETSFLTDSPVSPEHPKFVKLGILVRLWTALYGAATLPYVLLVQIRFRVVKAILKYNNLWDWAFVVGTTCFWLATVAVCGVIYPPTAKTQSMATAAWTIYALACDNVFSFIFLVQLATARAQLDQSIERIFRKVRRSLIVLCVMTWIGLAFSLIGQTVYSDSGMMRTLFFRISLLFSPLAYSNALMYIYTVRALFAPPKVKSSKTSAASGNRNSRSDLALNKKVDPLVLHTAAATGSVDHPLKSPLPIVSLPGTGKGTMDVDVESGTEAKIDE